MARLKLADALILIAAYDEETKIGGVVRGVRSKGYPVLVIDDGSSDRTAERARAEGAEVLRSNVNGGKGASIRKGIEHFLIGDKQVLILMDADGQHDPSDLEAFLEALSAEKLDFIVGNRMGDPGRMPFVRRITNRILSAIVSRAAGQIILDSQCGYRAIRREAVRRMTLKTSRYEIESEMLLQASQLGYAIGNVPVRCIYGNEKSRIRPFRDTLRFIRFIRSWRGNIRTHDN